MLEEQFVKRENFVSPQPKCTAAKGSAKSQARSSGYANASGSASSSAPQSSSAPGETSVKSEIYEGPRLQAAPSQPVTVTLPEVVTTEETDDLIMLCRVEEITTMLIQLEVGNIQPGAAEQILHCLRRMAQANKVMKEADTYRNDYHTWIKVNREFYSDLLGAQRAWTFQKAIISLLGNLQKEEVKMQKVDLNTATISQLEALGLQLRQINGIVEHRTKEVFVRNRDVLKVQSVGPRAYDKIKSYLKPLKYDKADPLDGGQTSEQAPTYTSSASLVKEEPMPEQNDVAEVLNLYGMLKPPNKTFVIGHAHAHHVNLIDGDDTRYILATTASKLQPGELWEDSGCVRGVGSKKEHEKCRKLLATLNFKPIRAECDELFQFGDGNVTQATGKFFYPVFLQNEYRGALNQAEVPVDCPLDV